MGDHTPKFNFTSFRDLLESCVTILKVQDELTVDQSDYDPWINSHPRLVCTPHALGIVLSNAISKLGVKELIWLIMSAVESDEDFQENFSILNGVEYSFTIFLGDLVGMQIYDYLRADSDNLKLVENRLGRALQQGADIHRDGIATGLVGWPK